jgi:hypothetical protein
MYARVLGKVVVVVVVMGGGGGGQRLLQFGTTFVQRFFFLSFSKRARVEE